jgi:hypothetical protein
MDRRFVFSLNPLNQPSPCKQREPKQANRVNDKHHRGAEIIRRHEVPLRDEGIGETAAASEQTVMLFGGLQNFSLVASPKTAKFPRR